MTNWFLALSFLLSLNSFAQPHRGLILPTVDSMRYNEAYCCVLSPANGFQVYDQPNGRAIAVLKRVGNADQDDQVPFRLSLVAGKQKTRFAQFREIEYDLHAINYIDSVNGFIRIGDSLKSYWLSVSELLQQGFKPVSWMEVMMKQCEQDLHFLANEPGLRLRKEPHTGSEVIGLVRGDLFQIRLSREYNGLWNKVKVQKLKRDPCESGMDDNIEFEWEGWLKVIDDSGEPNLWRYTRGC
ncbi:MAG TPA: hypothetical protein PKK69_03205 [Ferruginibacter sp.]|nr:hypothetical protein [Ferruginibacter sp.]